MKTLIALLICLCTVGCVTVGKRQDGFKNYHLDPPDPGDDGKGPIWGRPKVQPTVLPPAYPPGEEPKTAKQIHRETEAERYKTDVWVQFNADRESREAEENAIEEALQYECIQKYCKESPSTITIHTPHRTYTGTVKTYWQCDDQAFEEKPEPSGRVDNRFAQTCKRIREHGLKKEQRKDGK